MNKKQERREAKAAAKEARRHGDEPRYHCPFPGCGKTFFKVEGEPSVCPTHRQMIKDVVFILQHLKDPAAADGPATDQGPTLFIPKPGMENQAIREALKAKGEKP